MPLSRRAILIFGLTFLVLVGMLYLISQLILIDGYEQLENDTAKSNVRRVTNALNDELDGMLATNRDWAYWDDSYQYVQEPDEQYLEDNLQLDTLENLNLNWMYFVNQDGDGVYSVFFLPDQDAIYDVPNGIAPYFESNPAILKPTSDESQIKGVAMSDQGPILLTSLPILKNDSTGPSAGALIMGRLLNEERAFDLAESLQLSLSIFAVNDPNQPQDVADALENFGGGETYINPLDSDTVAGYTIIDDLAGNPALVVRVDMPRDILHQGQDSVQFFLISLVLVAFVVGVVMLLMLNRFVISPISTLSNEVTDISLKSNFKDRLSVEGNDEIATLGHNINSMLDSLNHAQEELSKANSLKSEFLSTMSHELRTPLNTIMGYTGVMVEGIAGEVDDTAKKMLISIQQSSSHLLNLINEVLDISKIESGRLELNNQPVSIKSMANAWKTRIQILSDKKKIDFISEIDPEFPQFILGDEERLTQIANNLLSNAIKFTDKGSVTMKITQQDKTWTLEVIDTGRGIPPQAQEYIFDEFRQVDGTFQRAHGGTGLGLAVVRKLCGVMGGTVVVDSTLGKGTTFRVTLPLKIASAEVFER